VQRRAGLAVTARARPSPPRTTGDGRWADCINQVPEFVGSRTLEAPLDRNATLLRGDLAEVVAKLKAQQALVA
jgi:hypothetical protein